MKKIFTLCLSLLATSLAVQAQEEELEPTETFRFVNTITNEPVEDGATLEVTELDEQGQMVVPLAIERVEDYDAAGVMRCDLTAMPNGVFSSCAFGQCLKPWDDSDWHDSFQNIIDDDFIKYYGNPSNIQTEWVPEAYATWTAKLQLFELEIVQEQAFPGAPYTDKAGTELIGFGPVVYIKFVYADPAAINETTAGATEQARFDLSGRQLTRSQKGINLVRLSDGTVRKVLVK